MLASPRWARWLLCLPLLVIGACQGDKPDDTWAPPPPPGDLAERPDPEAIVRRMISFMKDQRELAAEALVSYGAPQETGQTLQFDLLQRVALAKPDRLCWTSVSDDGAIDTAWFSDGKFTLLKQPTNVWAQVTGPSRISEMVDELAIEYELDIPFEDLVAGRELEKIWLGDAVTSVLWVGEAWVQGHWTDHIAISRPGVEFELWVRKGHEPFPAKLAIQYIDEEGQPSYVARFRTWSNTLPPWADFVFVSPPGAERIEIVLGGER